jgi:hypothetical protein
LFALARVCHCPPPVVDALRLPDFARLTAVLDAITPEDDTEEL